MILPRIRDGSMKKARRPAYGEESTANDSNVIIGRPKGHHVTPPRKQFTPCSYTDVAKPVAQVTG